jgi:hypothetical protein
VILLFACIGSQPPGGKTLNHENMTGRKHERHDSRSLGHAKNVARQMTFAMEWIGEPHSRQITLQRLVCTADSLATENQTWTEDS